MGESIGLKRRKMWCWTHHRMVHGSANNNVHTFASVHRLVGLRWKDAEQIDCAHNVAHKNTIVICALFLPPLWGMPLQKSMLKLLSNIMMRGIPWARKHLPPTSPPPNSGAGPIQEQRPNRRAPPPPSNRASVRYKSTCSTIGGGLLVWAILAPMGGGGSYWPHQRDRWDIKEIKAKKKWPCGQCTQSSLALTMPPNSGS